MKRLLLAALLCLPLSARAQMGLPLNVGPVFVPVVSPSNCPQGTAFSDGCSAAPSGTPQLPAILSSYSVRPPFNVPGVDYATGVPSGVTLADPATISMTGVTVNTGSHTVSVTGNNITLSGYDFGLANGWTVNVSGANDAIQNSHFKVGTNQGALGTVLNVSTGASNFTFQYNEVDGNNIGVTAQAGFTLGFNNSGVVTIQYNYLHNSGGDMLEMGGGNWTNQLIRYNLLRDIGYETAHSDTIQWCRSVLAAGDIAFNTVYQSQSGLSGEGLITLNSECPGSNIRNTKVRNNTLISLVQDNFIVGQTITQDAGAAAGDHNATYDNWTDPTGALNFTGAPWFPTGDEDSTLGIPAALHTLINMKTNTQIPVPTKTAPTSQGYYTYPDIATPPYSPSLSDVFTITPSPATGNITTGNTITFTLLMDAPTTVAGTPTIALNSGGVATYVSGSGTTSLVFNYTVGSSDGAATLAVNSISGSAKDDVGNATLFSPLTNLTTSFAGLSVNNGGTPTIALTSVPSNATISTAAPITFSYTVAAPAGLTAVWNPGSIAGTVTGFTASGGTGSASVLTPSTAATYTLTVTGTGSNSGIAVAPNSTTVAGSGSTCPTDDGSSGAVAGTANYPTLISGHSPAYLASINGPHGLGCKVAGVDYRVGLIATPTLANPTTGTLPSGATYSSGSHTVTVASNNVTLTGWDFSVSGGLQLLVNSGVTGTVIKGNKFVVASPNCLSPMRFNGLAGTTTVEYNSIDGGGTACASGGLAGGLSADVYMVSAAAGAVFIYQWNDHENIGEDGINVVGPSSGTPLTYTDQFNLTHLQGWTGHPDGVQFAGGRVASPLISHDTYFNNIFANQEPGVQPIHVEAQLTAAITNATVTFNTVLSPGTCNGGGDYPVGCPVNEDIACKDDTGSNTNTGFTAFGNYIDWSGAITALLKESGCTGAVFGSPFSNYDAVAGTTLTTSP